MTAVFGVCYQIAGAIPRSVREGTPAVTATRHLPPAATGTFIDRARPVLTLRVRSTWIRAFASSRAVVPRRPLNEVRLQGGRPLVAVRLTGRSDSFIPFPPWRALWMIP